MKKTILISAVGLLVATACSSDEVLRENTNTAAEPTIKFNTLVQNNTRAEADKTTLNAEGQSIRVDAFTKDGYAYYYYFGGKNDDNTSGELAKFDKDSETFKMVNTYYWPDEALYFVAWWPATIAPEYHEATVNNKTRYTAHRIQLTNEMLKNKTDVMVAASTAEHPYYWSTAHPLTFRHLFAQMIVQAKNAATEYNVEIKEVALRYMSSTAAYDGGCEMPTGKSEFDQNHICIKINLEGERADAAFFNSDSFVKDCDLSESASGVCAYKETKDQAITLNNPDQFTTLVGETEGGTLKNGFFMLDQDFGNTQGYSSPWDGSENLNGSYLSMKVKLTKNDGNNTQIYPDSKHADEDGYGWIAIPVFQTLKNILAGNKYIVNVTFTNDGAGQIPPGDDVDPGKPVLGKPIFFSVDCAGWVNNEVTATWESGNTGSQTVENQ